MVEIGKKNNLRVLKHVEFGVYLDGQDFGEILLPRRFVPETCEVDDVLEVFVCYDSNDRLVATTETPLAEVGDFAFLKVVAVENVGAFLDWGLGKDLFLPFSEQTRDVRVGHSVVVHLYLDKSGRISASMRLDKRKPRIAPDYKVGQSVNLIIAAKTDLGYKAIIEGEHWGVLFYNEVFQNLNYGQKIQGLIQKIRDDGKIDLALQPMKTGHKAADDITPKILLELEKNGGFLAINDKTPPEDIYELFGASKKKYKIALGGLYKKRLITVDEDGIRLAPKTASKK